MSLLAIPFPEIDPVALRLGPIAVKWYGLAYMAGLLLGWLYVKRLLRHAPDAKVIGSGGGTFAKDLVLMGVDAVGWAPGDEETYHQPNEEIEIEQLVVFAGRLAALAFEVASEKAPGR